MKNSENTDLVLRRCKTMNCVYEGQSFSASIVYGELGGRETTDATIKTMIAEELLSHGAHGTFVLTQAGASAISALVASKKPGHARSGSWQARRTVARPS